MTQPDSEWEERRDAERDAPEYPAPGGWWPGCPLPEDRPERWEVEP